MRSAIENAGSMDGWSNTSTRLVYKHTTTLVAGGNTNISLLGILPCGYVLRLRDTSISYYITLNSGSFLVHGVPYCEIDSAQAFDARYHKSSQGAHGYEIYRHD